MLLDQDLRPSAQESGQFVAHDVPFLSQGAADQLYLAVRLAICDMVLPRDRACPVLLDDALVNFDDERMMRPWVVWMRRRRAASWSTVSAWRRSSSSRLSWGRSTGSEGALPQPGGGGPAVSGGASGHL